MLNIFEIPEFKFDSEKLKQIYLNNKNSWKQYGKVSNTSIHTQYISKEAVLEYINKFKNYDELIFDVKFVKILKNGKIPPHTDPRKVAINIPVIVNKNQKICIYENKGGVDVENQPDGNRRLAKRYIPGEVIETFVSDKVFCLNTEATHGVINDGDKDRVVLSLKLKDK